MIYWFFYNSWLQFNSLFLYYITWSTDDKICCTDKMLTASFCVWNFKETKTCRTVLLKLSKHCVSTKSDKAISISQKVIHKMEMKTVCAIQIFRKHKINCSQTFMQCVTNACDYCFIMSQLTDSVIAKKKKKGQPCSQINLYCQWT